MKNLYTFLIVVLIFFGLFNVGCNKDEEFGEQPEEINTELLNTNIELQVSGFNNLDGSLAIAVFNNANSFESENQAYRDSTLSILDSEMNILINNIDPGTYAISVFHDADENGEITFGGFLNLIPQEGFGFSNNPNIGMSQPSYNECKFTIEGEQTLLVPITLVYL